MEPFGLVEILQYIVLQRPPLLVPLTQLDNTHNACVNPKDV